MPTFKILTHRSMYLVEKYPNIPRSGRPHVGKYKLKEQVHVRFLRGLF
ncbi:MAG: hypothetical protein ACREX4_07440 [Gammaproteobacteria bacterium]